MRCHICDSVLGPTDVAWSTLHDEFDPCPSCLLAISEVFNDLDDEEIMEEIYYEFPDLIDCDTEADHFLLDNKPKV